MALPLRDLLTSARPRQWVKNLFVLAPLIFAKRATDLDAAAAALGAAGLYCMASSAVYLFNDLRDVEQDRRHPEKRHRPIAAGRVGEGTALGTALLLAIGAVGGAALLGRAFAGVVVAYLLLNVAYTLKLKHVAYVDVTIIALGFLLRVIGGGLAIPVEVSGWILLRRSSSRSTWAWGNASTSSPSSRTAGDDGSCDSTRRTSHGCSSA